jgi:tetratricopeptide (TPR) repeat protein
MAVVEKTLQEGIQAVKGGNFERARRLFNLVVEEDPDSEQGWYWLGLIASDQDKRIACFLRTLDINPANQEVREKLIRLGVPMLDELGQPDTGPNGLKPGEEDTGPLPTVIPQNQAEKYSRPVRAPEIFQPLEEDEQEQAEANLPDDQSVALSESDLFHTRAYSDDNLSDLYDEDFELESIPKRQSSLVGRLLPILVILLLLACTSIIYLGTQADGLPFGLALARASATPTPTATRAIPTPTITRTPQPTSTATPIPPSPSPIPTLSALDNLSRLNSLFGQALSLSDTRQYSEATLAWSKVIDAAPDYAGAYYGRGRSYLALATQDQQQPDNAHELLKNALEDLNQAILLGPPRAAYYQTRYEILDWLIGLESFRATRQPLLEQMLEDIQTAAIYGLISPFDDPNPGNVLLRLERCSEAMDYFGQQVGTNPAAVPPASLYTNLARTYLCFGHLRGASQYANLASSVEPTPERDWIRAITTFNQGRYNETLRLLDELLEANPDSPGDRYFLRALVRIQRREHELARVDLELGSQRSLDQGQLAAYASALLARQAGDEAGAEAFFSLAEETLSPEYGLVLDRVRKELDLPVPNRGVLSLPKSITNYLADLPETIQPAALLVEPDEVLLPVSYDGSGPFHLPRAGLVNLHLYPPVQVEILFVDSLTLRLSPGSQASLDDVSGSLWNFSQGDWEPISLNVGDNPVVEPSRFVNPRGDIFFRLENLSGATQAIDNLNLTLVIAGQQNNAQP